MRLSAFPFILGLTLGLLVPAQGRAQEVQQEPEDPTVAAFRFRAEQGEARAQYAIGFLYTQGRAFDVRLPAGAEQDRQAVAWLRKSANQGLTMAAFTLGHCFESGSGVAQDPAEALWWYRTAAEEGDAQAQSYLGMKYCLGYDVPEDPAEGLRWLRLSAAQQEPVGMIFLGYLHEFGRGVPRDHAAALKWFQAAALQRLDEVGTTRKALPTRDELVEALRFFELKNWYLNGAELGHPEAQDTVGTAYRIGFGVVASESEAAKWFRRAAEQGHSGAQLHFAECCANGSGVAHDPVQAVKWFRLAAEQGNSDAQSWLGRSYRMGQAVPQDEVEAYVWFSLAAEHAAWGATDARNELATRLNPEVLVQAEARAAALRAAIEARKQVLHAPDSGFLWRIF